MASIVFCVFPMAGTMNPSLKFARTLKARGHNVHYIGIPDCENYLKTTDLTLIPVFSRWFPKGYVDEVRRTQKPQSRKSRKANTGSFKPFFDALIEGTAVDFKAAIGRLRPDLILIPSGTFDSTVCEVLPKIWTGT
jgi:zeaxanthin glucosyltransferase